MTDAKFTRSTEMIEVHKRKDARGRIKEYSARIGTATATYAATEKEAVAKALKQRKEAMERLHAGVRTFSKFGLLAVVVPGVFSFEYQIFDSCDTSKSFNTLDSNLTIQQACAQVRFYMALRAWSNDCQDDYLMAFAADLPPQMHKELLSYWAWQRDYRRLKNEGATDQEAHSKAQNNVSLLRGTP